MKKRQSRKGTDDPRNHMHLSCLDLCFASCILGTGGGGGEADNLKTPLGTDNFPPKNQRPGKQQPSKTVNFLTINISVPYPNTTGEKMWPNTTSASLGQEGSRPSLANSVLVTEAQLNYQASK